jgi:hypothetical protein
MEQFSESACFHRLHDLFWCIREPQMAPFLTPAQERALAEFDRLYRSLPWRVIAAHSHISEVLDDDLSPLVAPGLRLLELIEIPSPHATTVS